MNFYSKYQTKMSNIQNLLGTSTVAAATGDLSTFKTSSGIFQETATFDLPTFNSYPSLDTQQSYTRKFEVTPKRSDFSPVAQNLGHVRSP